MPDLKNNDAGKFESALKKLIKKLQKTESDRTEPEKNTGGNNTQKTDIVKSN